MDLLLFILSVFAAFFSTAASLPQLLRNETSSLSNISMGMRLLGAILWASYGLFRKEYVLMACSSTAGIIEVMLLCKTRRSLPNDTLPTPTGGASS